MELIAVFEETDTTLSADFQELDDSFPANFGEITVINEIPQEYGLITYDHNKTITVS